jgi:hypothetical protein
LDNVANAGNLSIDNHQFASNVNEVHNDGFSPGSFDVITNTNVNVPTTILENVANAGNLSIDNHQFASNFNEVDTSHYFPLPEYHLA